MPRLIDPGNGDPIDLEDLVDALEETPFDVRDESSFAALGPLLARLGRNRDFLADLAIAELKDRCEGQAASNSYGPQVFVLRPPGDRYLLRANFWPARNDAVVRTSGTAPFFYDMPHDHNFPFLTVGYLGPGYWSDYYDYDVGAVAGVPGEVAGLRFAERARLETGKLMLYRARRDVHVQLPPDSFSVSLNILGYHATQPWQEQFRFDVCDGTIAEGLTTTGSEALVALAVHFGGGNGLDLAHDLARRHPASRMRVTAINAIASTLDDPDDRAEWYAAQRHDADRYVVGHANHQLARLGRPAVG